MPITLKYLNFVIKSIKGPHHLQEGLPSKTFAKNRLDSNTIHGFVCLNERITSNANLLERGKEMYSQHEMIFK